MKKIRFELKCIKKKILPLLLIFLTLSVSAGYALAGGRDQFKNDGGSGDSNKKEQRPIIKNPRFENGALYIEAAGSFIQIENAKLKVNDKESFPLSLDESQAYFRVGHDRDSDPGKIKIGQAIPTGIGVSIVVENPNGSKSDPVTFKR
jgi:hypothetical protein